MWRMDSSPGPAMNSRTSDFRLQTWIHDAPVTETIEIAASLGYSGVELAGRPHEYDWDALRRQLDEGSLRASALSVMDGNAPYDLVHPDSNIREGTLAYLTSCLEMVAALGGDFLTTPVSSSGKVSPMANPEQEWDWAIDGLRRLVDRAGELGLRVAIAPLNRYETYFLRTADHAIELAEAIGETCGVALDTFHMTIEEVSLSDAIERSGDRLVDLHVADSNRGPCGAGAIDWRGVLEALARIGYGGPLTAEFYPPQEWIPPDRAISRPFASLAHQSIETLRAVAFGEGGDV